MKRDNIILFHQYFLGKNDSGGSRWNQFTHFFANKENLHTHVLSGNIHYSTGEQMGKNKWRNKEEVEDGVTVYRTWTYAGYNANFIGRLIGYLSYTVSSLLQGLFIRNAKLIIATSPPLFVGISAILLSKLKRIPLIIEIRDLWPESAIATGVLKNKYLINTMYFIEKQMYKHASKIAVLTPAFKRDIQSRFPEYAEKLHMIPNGADFSIMQREPQRNEIRQQYNWNNKTVLAYFGAHGVANDLIQVINVAEHFQDTPLQFVLIGDGMQKPMLKEEVTKRKLHNIDFIDSVPKHDVPHYIAAADICMAILKKTDTFKTVYPNKVFDYMSCKKPCLVAIDGITRELIETAQCGVYVEPENIEDFKEKVMEITSKTNEELSQLGDNGYHYVKEHFNREVIAQNYLKILKPLLQ
jgi:glycosyltransferase involved in cell wall biosynthesis